MSASLGQCPATSDPTRPRFGSARDLRAGLASDLQRNSHVICCYPDIIYQVFRNYQLQCACFDISGSPLTGWPLTMQINTSKLSESQPRIPRVSPPSSALFFDSDLCLNNSTPTRNLIVFSAFGVLGGVHQALINLLARRWAGGPLSAKVRSSS